MSRSIGIIPRYGSVEFTGIQPYSYSDLETELEEQRIYIQSLEDELKMLSTSTPKDITPKDEDPIEYIKNRIRELLSELRGANYREAYLMFFKDLLDEWKFGPLNEVSPNSFTFTEGLDPRKTEVYELVTQFNEDVEQEATKLFNKFKDKLTNS